MTGADINRIPMQLQESFTAMGEMCVAMDKFLANLSTDPKKAGDALTTFLRCRAEYDRSIVFMNRQLGKIHGAQKNTIFIKALRELDDEEDPVEIHGSGVPDGLSAKQLDVYIKGVLFDNHWCVGSLRNVRVFINGNQVSTLGEF